MSLKKAAILHLHGQGGTKEHASDEMFHNIIDSLIGAESFYFQPIKYYSPLYKNQNKMIDKVDSSDASYMCVRENLIQSFGDTATIYHDTRSYDQVSNTIKSAVLEAKEKIVSNGPIFVIAHSLGSMMFSNYMWDMQQAGIIDPQIAGIYTTGSPMHIFLSGMDYNKIEPIQKTHDKFEWINFWNPKDLISSELGLLSKKYYKLVKDVKVKRGFPVAAHGKYAGDDKVIDEIVESIERIISST